ncbi:MAG: class I SAM-dependent methyltransferase [Pseudomonadota bacterium]|nr:class I SAM-dependent methyltransferase [Pseudomonadota bacterium]
MDDQAISPIPVSLPDIERETIALGFDMPSERHTGAFLRALAASKPAGRILELGTGTGLAMAWMLDGLGPTGTLLSIDSNPSVSAVAAGFLGSDPRVTFVVTDANGWFPAYGGPPLDLIFADAVAGKYENFESAWDNLALGGLYIIDNMLPQDNWPTGHDANVERLLSDLDARSDCHLVRMNWASGLVLACRTA